MSVWSAYKRRYFRSLNIWSCLKPACCSLKIPSFAFRIQLNQTLAAAFKTSIFAIIIIIVVVIIIIINILNVT